MSTMPEKRIIKRRKTKIKRNPNSTSDSHYFTSDTQDSIVKYQNSLDEEEKKVIYVKEILPAFNSLVENLINVYGFKVRHDSKEDLKYECLEFLYAAVPKFKAEKGSKAFSYFNVVARHWLTIKAKQNTRRLQQYISLDDVLNISSVDMEKIESYNMVPSYDDIISQKDIKDFLDKLLIDLEVKARTHNEKITISAIKEIIVNIEDLELLSKRAVLLYIRQLTQLSSKQLSLVLSSLKKNYKEFKNSLED